MKRNQSLTIRIENRTKFIVDIASRIRRSNLSSVIQYAVHNYAKELFIERYTNIIDNVYDVDELESLKKLKTLYPELLTYDEEILLKQLEVSK